MKRTQSGLQNSSLFYDVDYVVYVEGGKTDKDMDDTADTLGSLDVLFWKTVFERITPSTTVKFKAVGSKTQLIPIADDIVNNNICNIIVAMDRDFEFHLGTLRDDSRVIYTRGYSWENDVWDLDGLPRLIEAVSIQSPLPSKLISEVTACIERFRLIARRTARLDVASVVVGQPPIIKRNEMRRYLSTGKTHPPYCNRVEIRKRIAQRRRDRIGPVRRPEGKKRETDELDCFGHFVGCFGYHILRYSLSKQGLASHIPQCLSSVTAIREFGTEIARGGRSAASEYYEAVIREAISY